MYEKEQEYEVESDLVVLVSCMHCFHFYFLLLFYNGILFFLIRTHIVVYSNAR